MKNRTWSLMAIGADLKMNMALTSAYIFDLHGESVYAAGTMVELIIAV